MHGNLVPGRGTNEFEQLVQLTAKVGSQPLLTQASTGNSSIKIGKFLWIKASGKWMANALRDDIFIRLDRSDVIDCLRRGIDPGERFPSSSLETAMHAVLRHRVVLHVHCINTIAWAVRTDAVSQLEHRLKGLPWRWIPYVPSGTALSHEIERGQSASPDANVFVLGNHGLVIGAGDAAETGELLSEISRRLDIRPRTAGPPDDSALHEVCTDPRWILPQDPGVHALAVDSISQSVLAGGLLYPCQAIFTGAETSELFRAIPLSDHHREEYRDRSFLIIEGCGVVLNRSARIGEIAMLSGLASTVQRISASAPVRYLTRSEIAGIAGQVAYRYRELANVSQPATGL
jgi:ribulose-5-phosphate 4-epimerase/fuculose-1-phosphate aldolase